MSFFLGNSYLQLLIKSAAFAAANPALFRELWNALLAAYQKSLDFAAKVKEAIGADAVPDEGTLQMIAATDEELDAEEQIAALLYPEGTQALREAEQFRKVFTWLTTSDIGRSLLAEVLKRMGS